MINWTSYTDNQILLFALVLLRMIPFIISSAIFGTPSISTQLKVLLSIVFTVIIFPTIKAGNVNFDLISHDIIFLVIREMSVGLTLGFLTRIFFFAVMMTGEMVSVSVGLGASQLYNPMTGSHGSSIEQFYVTLASMVFLSINGHHLLISGIAQSYTLIPVSELHFNFGTFAEIATYLQNVLVMAIKMCAPVLVTVLIVNLAMGILGRAVPQINVLVTSMPVTIILGMAVIFVSLPLLVIELNGLANITAEKLFSVMKSL